MNYEFELTKVTEIQGRLKVGHCLVDCLSIKTRSRLSIDILIGISTENNFFRIKRVLVLA